MASTPDTKAPQPKYPSDLDERRLPQSPIQVRRRTGRAGNLVVACVLDEFSFNSFASEADFAPLTMANWEVELAAAQPDLLFVESAWRGHKQTWWNTVHRHGDEITGIVAWCKERGIPTAFWNKEDPVHFNTFLTTASMFDAVFTTDVDCVARYKQALGHDNVHFLPFAAQTADSNPIEAFARIDGCAFAGAYYEKYPDRTADLGELSKELSSNGRRFDIYDRNYGKDTPGYMFPSEYQDLIVGGALPPTALDIPYKGYTTNLNLNSVKQSQSMFARRVFELMASNTLVVSNFARGLRVLFGDLALTTDSGSEMRRRLDTLDAEPNGNQRLRSMALRKVLSEHTYTERLEFIATKAGVDLDESSTARPLFVLDSTNADPLPVIEMMLEQSWTDWQLAVVGPHDAELPEDQRVHEITRPEIATLGAEHGCTLLGVLDPRSWYGPHYVLDLVQALQFADVTACGHADRFAASTRTNGLHRVEAGSAWAAHDSLALQRSLIQVDSWDSDSAFDFAHVQGSNTYAGLAVSPLQYIERGAHLAPEHRAAASDLNVNPGLSLTELRDFAASQKLPDVQDEETPTLRLEDILTSLPESSAFSFEPTDAGGFELTSRLEQDKHAYWNSPDTHPVPQGWAGKEHTFFFDIGTGLNVILVIYFLDEKERRLSHAMLHGRKNTTFSVPADTTHLRWGLRLTGFGTCEARPLKLGPYTPPPVPLLNTAKTLLISNIYPSYEHLYRNGFVHKRVAAYNAAGLRTEVLIPSDSSNSKFREFANIDVTDAPYDVLQEKLENPTHEHLVIHTLTPALWTVLKRTSYRGKVTVWVHGFEIQPWWRRAFNYSTDAELAEAKELSAKRVEFWKQVFADTEIDAHFVFVSHWLAETAFDDIGIELPDDRYSVINNPVDTDLFSYTEKAPEMRKRILSIRPYASRVYANDLSVEAVLKFSEHRDFADHHFAFYGDGMLFEETVEPLRQFDNVEIHQKFLTHSEIAALHKEYGVLLVPTRSDTQGVSRDEAMSSGLVPVTSKAAAVPEFMSPEVGFMAEFEDSDGLAAALRTLSDSAETFKTMSKKASEAVASSRSDAVIIPQEIEVITAPGRDSDSESLPAAPDRPTFSILGSCVTRDAFDSSRAESISNYSARTALGTSLAPAPNVYVDLDRIASAFQKRMVDADIAKNSIPNFVNAEADLYIYDLIDERLSIAEWPDGSALTVSNELMTSGFRIPEAVLQHNLTSERNFDLWAKGWDSLIAKMRERGIAGKFVIHRAFWAEHTDTLDGPAPVYALSTIQNANAALQRRYDYIAETAPEVRFIEVEPEFCVADSQHKWGLSPFHFAPGYYPDLIAKLDEAAGQ